MKNLFSPKPYGAIITVPNIITVVGILLLIPYVWYFLTGGNRWVMFGSLFLSGFSDLIDGFLARRLRQKTYIGAIIDPLRDRLVCLAVLGNAFFLEKGQLIISLIIVIIVLELMILVVNPNHCYDDCNFKVQVMGKLRQLGHVLASGLAIIVYYFNDIIVGIFGNLNFSFARALVIMVLCSALTLVYYALCE